MASVVTRRKADVWLCKQLFARLGPHCGWRMAFRKAERPTNLPLARLCRLVGVIAGVRIEHCRIQSLIDSFRVEKALARHVPIEVAGAGEGSHDPRYGAIVFVSFLFQILLSVGWITPLEALFDGKMRILGIVKSHAYV